LGTDRSLTGFRTELVVDAWTETLTAFYDQPLTVSSGVAPAEVLSSILAPDFVSRGSEDTETREQLIDRFGFFGQLIPNLKTEIQEVLNDGDRYIVRSNASGTPNGDFMGVDTDGSKSFEIMTIDIHTVVDG
jgi:hypothetical protein